MDLTTRAPANRAILWTLAILACGFAHACSKKSAPSPTSQPAQGLRIVSLSPAISRTLIDFDLAKHIVGRSPYCSSIDQSIPVVGDLLTIDYEQIIRLNPTHILVQPPAAGVDAALVDLARKQDWKIADWWLNGVDDIRTLIDGIPVALCNGISPNECVSLRGKADALAKRIDAALAKPTENDCFAGRVLIVSSVNPALAYGDGTFLNDILLALGGVNAVRDRGWVQLSMEDIVRLTPDAIIRVKPGGDSAKLIDELGPLATIDVPAVKANRLAMLSHIDAELPSSGVIGVAEEMRGILKQFAASGGVVDNRP